MIAQLLRSVTEKKIRRNQFITDISEILFTNRTLLYTAEALPGFKKQVDCSMAIPYPSGMPDPTHLLPEDTEDTYSLLEECLNRMPLIQKKAFVYKTFGDKKTSSICKDLNINETVFWILIHNARKELVQTLNLA